MCGRFTLFARGDDLVRRFGLGSASEAKPLFNIAPTNQVPVIRAEGGGRTATNMMWWLIPAWADGPKPGKYSTFNARAETVDTLASFRGPFKSKRCLIPASGLIEWKHVGGGKLEKKFPFHFSRKDGGLLAYAGLWERWQKGDEPDVLSCTIIVFEPSDLVKGVHGRMPVVLPPETWDAWLDPKTDPAAAKDMLRVYPGFDDVREVNPALNSGKFKGPECLDPPPEGESAAEYESLLAAKGTFGVSADGAPRKPRARKPKQEADLFSTKE